MTGLHRPLLLILGGALAGVAVFNLLAAQGLVRVAWDAEPSRVELRMVVDPGCADCFNLSPLLDSLQGTSSLRVVQSRWVDGRSPEGRELAREHNLSRAPALVATGEVLRSRMTWESAGGRLHDGAAVVEPAGYPYTDLSSGSVVGRVSATVVGAPGCPDCADPWVVLSPQLARFGVSIPSPRMVEGGSPEGLALRERYRIEKLPGLVLSPEASLYPGLVRAWLGAGSAEADGALVLRNNAPPYLNATSGRVEGRVRLVSLADASCPACYNTTLLERTFASMGVVFGEARRLDAASGEGADLVRKYNITRVPTVLLSSDAGLYAEIASLWSRVGSVEPDGWWVFRRPDLIAPPVTYRNLTSGT